MGDRRKALAEMREKIASLERDLQAEKDHLWRTSQEYGKYSSALDGLMRDVAAFVADPYLPPTSIFSGKLIKALAKASAEIGHG